MAQESGSSEAARPSGYVALLRTNRNFRQLWLGQIVSLAGDWFNLIASAALVAQLTESGFAVGGLFVVRMLAPFLTSPLAGVAADRYNRKWVLVTADVTRIFIVLGFLFVRQPSLVWLLYALTALQLGVSGFFFAARNAILPDIVAPRDIGTANAISSVTWSVMLALGAAAGGLVAGTVGIYPAFVIDAATFVFSALALSRIRSADLPVHAAEQTLRAAVRQYLDGLGYLRRHRDTLAVALHKAALTFLFGPTLNVVYVAIAERVFPWGEGTSGISLGLMFAAGGVGTALGPLVARQITADDDRRLRRAIVVGYLVGGLGVLLAAPLGSFPQTLAGFLLSGAGNGLVWVFSTQLLLHQVPGTIRGRIFASEFAFFTLTSACGATLAGLAVDSPLGIGGVLAVMSGLALLPAALWTLWLALYRPA